MINPVFMFVLIVAIMAGLLVYLWWWNAHGDGKRERDRVQAESRRRGPRLQMLGWRYEASNQGRSGYRVRGITKSGLDWTLDYDPDHSSSSPSPRLTYRVASLKGDDYQWEMVDRWGFELIRKGISGKLISGLAAIGSALSEDMARKRDFFLGAAERPAGSAALRERYVLIAQSARFDALIDSESESRILHWPDFKPAMSRVDNCLSAGLRPEGLEVKLYVHDPEIAVIEQVVNLGQQLTESSARLLGR